MERHKAPTSTFPKLWAAVVAEALRVRPNIVGTLDQAGATNIGLVQYAISCIELGQAEVVAIAYGDNPRTGTRATYARPRGGDGSVAGLFGAPSGYAMAAQRRRYEYGTTKEQLGHVAMTHRHHASMNPGAVYLTPITMEEYMAARWVAEPFGLLDCCPVFAGEFMVMAATLIHIKSKMLVPVAPTEAQGDEEAEDPREALVRRLLEFQRYREAAGILHQMGEIRAATWTRPESGLPDFDDAGEPMLEAGLFDIIGAFKEMLERRKAQLALEVASGGKSLEERLEELLDLIKEGQSLDFLELFRSQQTKADMIVTFLALLELIRLRRIKVYQRGLFGPIRVFRPLGPA